MKQLILFTSLLFGLLNAALAQESSLSGRLRDSVNFKPMAYSSVSLIRYKDSILIHQLWVQEDETFQFTKVQPDTYVLQITRPSFVDYEDKLIIRDGEQRDIGTVFMISRANLLKEVIIKERSNAIKIKGDTTEFLVDSFLTNKNSNVEDLLKRLPGIQVDKDGKIVAQGQEVKKVLVDGEEFFGEDPTVATRNLRAENVEKVQVFDKKSEQAAFTGIDDGQKEKTINLQLKEDAKKGYFGKVSGGAGTNSRYEHDGMVNFFKQKRKFSAYGAMSNTNKTRLSWDDANKYGGSSDNVTEYDDNSGMMYTYSSWDNMNFDGVGIPQTWYGGLHYSDKVNQDKHAYAVNLTKKDLISNGIDNNYSKYILPDTLYYVNTRMDVNTHKLQTAGSANYELKLDSLTTIKMKLSVKDQEIISSVNTTSDNYNSNEVLVNKNNRLNRFDNHTQMLTSSLSYNRKFKTTGRSLMIQGTQSYSGLNGESFVASDLQLYDTAGAIISQNTIDQRKINHTVTNTYTGTMTYTEPLSKTWFVVSDYYTSATLTTSDQTTNAKQNGEYSLLVDSLSNRLAYDIYTQRAGLAVRYVTKKINFTFGGKTSYTDMKQTQRDSAKTFSQYFFNVFPNASFNYKLTGTSSFNISYNGSTRQPSMQQIQPLQDVSNPLNINIGNPALKQSFNNRFSCFINSYKPLTGTFLYASLTYSFTNGDFASYDLVDAYGRKTHQTVNVDGNNNFYGYMYYGYEMKKYHLNFSANMNGSANTNVNFINGYRNVNRSQNVSLGPDIRYDLDKKMEAGIGVDLNFNHGTSSLRPDIITKYWTTVYSVYGTFYLPKKFTLNFDCNYNVRQKTDDFQRNVNVTMLNAGIKKKFLKSESLEVGIKGFDLLNQNLGFDRNVSSNYVNEHTYTVLKNYFLFTVVWNFTKGPVEQDED